MIVTLLIWAYMLPVCYILGFGLISLTASKNGGYVCRYEISYILAGLGIVTFYAQLYSLFGGVGLWANCILIVLTIMTAIWKKKALTDHLMGMRSARKPESKIGSKTGRKTGRKTGKILVILLLTLIFAYGSSTGIIHYDSDLYHAQSIRWIEEYGLVAGLGNIHTRLAYNSSAFPLTALFSMSFMGGQSFHVCSGFLALLVALLCGDLFKKGSLFKPSLANIVRIVAIYYLLIIFDEMVSPESDYFMVLETLALFILYFSLIEDGEEKIYPYTMLTLLGVTIATVKISGALVVLVFVYPLILAFRDKDILSPLRCLILGIITALPFFIRNIILSGYLVYPVTAIDIFDVVWKIPKDIAEYDSKEIRVYGRGYTDVSRFDEPLSDWLPSWLSGLDMVNKISFCLAAAGLALLVLIILYTLLKKKKDGWGQLTGIATVSICFLLWFFTSPNIRYGCVFLWLAPLLTWGYLYINFLQRFDRGRIFALMAGLLFVFKTFTFGREQLMSLTGEYLLFQKDYGTYELVETQIDGVTFYKPAEGDRTGYAAFPALPYEAPNAALMGNDIKDGFYTTGP